LYSAAIVDIAILLCATLLAQRRRRLSRIEEEADRVAEASHRWLTPLTRGAYLKKATQLESFRDIDDYIIEVLDEQLIAVPEQISSDPEQAVRDRMIFNSVRAGRGTRARNLISSKKVSNILEMRRSPAAGRGAYTVWRMPEGFWNDFYDSAINAVRQSETAGSE
jgi:hypothetical protein